MTARNLPKIGAISGIAGPVVFGMVLAVLGALYPGYSHISQTMSVLGATDAPHRVIMNSLGFPLLGLLIIVFAVGIDRGIKRSGIWWAGPALTVISGVALSMTAVFSDDPQNVDATWRGTAHAVFAGISVVSFAVAPAFFGLRQWSDSRWKRFAAFSWIIALITLLLSGLSSLDVLEPYVGLLQRTSVGVPMGWTVITSARLLHISNEMTCPRTK